MEESNFFVPVGFKFVPSDEELLQDYLYKKVSAIPIPYVSYIVKQCDLYGEEEPKQIWESNGGNLLNEGDVLYFFTKLKKKTPKGSRIDRKIGAGAWQGENAPENILSTESQKIIGSKKRFRYENKGSEDDGCWIMHEYTLHPSFLEKNQSMQYVLCKIRKNEPTGKRKNKKSGLGKKRKLQDFQNHNQLVKKQSFQRREAREIDYSRVIVAGKYDVPDETIQTLTTVQSAEYERMLFQQQENQKISSDSEHNFQGTRTGGIDSGGFGGEVDAMMLREDNEDDPLSGICDEDIRMLRKHFDKDPTGESVDWVNMPCLEQMLSDLPELLSEEYDFVPCGDGESYGNTNCSVDMIMKEQNLSDLGGESIHQRTECASDGPMAFPSQTLVSEIPQLRPDENVISPGATVKLGTMQSLSELSKLPSKEAVLTPIGGEIITSTDVDWATSTTMDEVQVSTVPENYGSICSCVSLGLDDCLPLDPWLLFGEDFYY